MSPKETYLVLSIKEIRKILQYAERESSSSTAPNDIFCISLEMEIDDRKSVKVGNQRQAQFSSKFKRKAGL